MKNRFRERWGTAVAAFVALALVGLGLKIGSLWAQAPPPDPPEPLASLKTVPVPEPPNLGEFIQDKVAAIRLGKALFWDVQVGSDGMTACASCHFHAGADNRRKNQLSPGLLAGDTTFQLGGSNYTLRPEDFPLTKHADENVAGPPIVSDTNDVVSSQGVFRTEFVDVSPGKSEDVCTGNFDPVFHVGGITVRRVEPRNTPSAFNAVFNFRNFWDGRANNNFNGVNPFGQRDPNAKVWRISSTGQLEQVSVVIPLASLASQAVGPPLSPFEMSCAGRIWAKIGKKLLAPGVIPLAKQFVDPADSVLGASGAPGSTGLTVSYEDLIRQAFRPEWWSHPGPITLGNDTFSQMEANFSLFFGLSVQLYEATLVANGTRLDRFLEGDSTALSPLEQEGMNLFTGQGRCSQCHGGAELTNASVRNVMNERLERMVMGDGGCAIYDNGFYNIGVRPTAEDLGVGGTDPFGNPLSETRLAMLGMFVDPNLQPPLGSVPECDSRANVDGAFKTPALRNVELTGPYFHNGGKATLMQVVQFYNRGGDFAMENLHNLDPDIQPLGLTQARMDALVAFLQALTDERARQETAPLDHPQLFRPNGCVGDDKDVAEERSGTGGTGQCVDDMEEVPAVGAGGRPEAGLVPLQPFMTVSQLTGSGRLGSGRDIATLGFQFRLKDGEPPQGKLRYEDKGTEPKLKIHADSIDRHESTETCVRVWGPARVNGTDSYRFTAKGCDHRQPGHLRDSFEIAVWDVTGMVVYERAGVLSGGNLQAHIK